ncbi:MAG: hypothetical protein AAF739_00430 [Pseudomonadota bacterium]
MEPLLEQKLRRNLIALCDAYEAASQRAWSINTVCHRILRQPDFMLAVRSDARGFNVRKHDQLVSWLSQNWPLDAIWPDDVPRPGPAALAPSVAADGADPAQPAEAAE